MLLEGEVIAQMKEVPWKAELGEGAHIFSTDAILLKYLLFNLFSHINIMYALKI